MLKVNDLNVFYGGIHALRGVSIDVEEGQVVAVIGSNGAGKSSLMNAISSTIKYKGSIEFCGQPLTTKAHRVVKAGISHVPEGRLIFANLTTFDNLRMGAYLRKDFKGINEDMERVCTIFPRLKERARQLAGTLSGGEQQMLAMGRGLMSNPRLLLLDEPSLGLAPLLINTIFDIILEIRKMGKTILLVEQNAFKALSIADRAYVLNQGRVGMSGDAAAIMADPSIREAYLGKAK
jgi:branched-chain amino acid transport system ATP-binding protein